MEWGVGQGWGCSESRKGRLLEAAVLPISYPPFWLRSTFTGLLGLAPAITGQNRNIGQGRKNVLLL